MVSPFVNSRTRNARNAELNCSGLNARCNHGTFFLNAFATNKSCSIKNRVTTPRNVTRSTAHNAESSVDTTVAFRGQLYNKAISPKESPTVRIAIIPSVPFRMTLAAPDSMT